MSFRGGYSEIVSDSHGERELTGAAIQVQSAERDRDELHAGRLSTGRVERVESVVHRAASTRQIVKKIHRIDELLENVLWNGDLHVQN